MYFFGIQFEVARFAKQVWIHIPPNWNQIRINDMQIPAQRFRCGNSVHVLTVRYVLLFK